eukprot:TRINITY_DN4073_c2_g2_i1.p1 TRINITY_DN4073_c2_g2~~TRINITY_DN4073_c2_g2_i1.p1  ORF type:complete len:314 (-),score=87.76 TRINITY_DN4073_c2_g2_i1:341-1282(-)
MQIEGGLFLGVDGGGTSTQGILIDSKDNILGKSYTQSSNWNSVGEIKAKEALVDCINNTLINAKKEISDVSAICLALAGVDRPNDIEMVQGWMKETYTNTKVYIMNDAIAALASGTRGKLEGIVVISGTGTICYGVLNGKKSRSSGWGPLFYDIGSGYNLGVRILKAVSFANDGRGEYTSLLPALLEHLKIDDCAQLIPWAYTSLEWSRIASISFLCQQEALKGDKIATKILNKVTNSLAESVFPVHENLQFGDEFTIVLAGTVFTHQGSLIGAKVKEILQKKYPKSNIIFPQIDESHAAALLAKSQLELEDK